MPLSNIARVSLRLGQSLTRFHVKKWIILIILKNLANLGILVILAILMILVNLVNLLIKETLTFWVAA